MQRRQFLFGSAALVALGGAAGYKWSQQKSETSSVLVSAAKHRKGGYYVLAVKSSGQLVSQTFINKRAHDTLALARKRGHVLVFARRPDTFAHEIDVVNGQITKSFSSQQGRHFYGHGTLSHDGRYLFTTENDFENERGLIVVRDTSNYQVIEEFDSGGIGPHQLKLMPSGKQIVVANGGILTHPDWPRLKLNVDTMSSNLAYIDVQSGKVEGTFTPDHHQQSIRHIDVNNAGKVAIGIQFQGSRQQQLPLVYTHNGQYRLQAMTAPDAVWQTMQQYTASVMTHGSNVYVSCPRGNLLTQWNINSQTLIAQGEVIDAAGIATAQSIPMVSSGIGELVSASKCLEMDKTDQISNKHISNFKFDNHMTEITLS